MAMAKAPSEGKKKKAPAVDTSAKDSSSETSAKARKKVKRLISDGIAHIYSSFNNTIVTITDVRIVIQKALRWVTFQWSVLCVEPNRK